MKAHEGTCRLNIGEMSVRGQRLGLPFTEIEMSPTSICASAPLLPSTPRIRQYVAKKRIKDGLGNRQIHGGGPYRGAYSEACEHSY